MKRIMQILLPLLLLIGGIFFLNENVDNIAPESSSESSFIDEDEEPKLELKAVSLPRNTPFDTEFTDSIYHGDFFYNNMDISKEHTLTLSFVNSKGEPIKYTQKKKLEVTKKMYLQAAEGKIYFALYGNHAMEEYFSTLEDSFISIKLENTEKKEEQ